MIFDFCGMICWHFVATIWQLECALSSAPLMLSRYVYNIGIRDCRNIFSEKWYFLPIPEIYVGSYFSFFLHFRRLVSKICCILGKSIFPVPETLFEMVAYGCFILVYNIMYNINCKQSLAQKKMLQHIFLHNTIMYFA